MASKQDWLDAGLAILAEYGAPGLTIERLTERLGLSKGSFYHHFKGMAGYRTALLDRIADQTTHRFIDLVEREPGRTARERLRLLTDLVSAEAQSPALEIAVRAWAQQNPEVRAAQERIDHTRTEYLRGLWMEMTGDPDEAARMSWLLYLIVIGADHIVPPIAPPQLRDLFHTAIGLADRSDDRPEGNRT
ncbi:TetR family transcriptional regulator [Actinomadura pelletieri DSM 43383]|uniref:TetR family transcriptional regulator n=1 Tax=Actinomadura pelletieri DSM 43383 TaxID=1120940 RepID=A0A495QMX3_9ACTN|nr:TetR/AcrR family transcriptional regulator [Actinomadura pelletieri]RKS74276.1 TetR family transcriptional regulator [Actinomadura pelletieri DSM 43383]